MPIPHDVSTPPEEILNFGSLVNAIQQTHAQSAAAMSRVVNVTLTLRNWFIGAYIVEYEMRGEDRAKYGDGLMTALAKRLTDANIDFILPPQLRFAGQPGEQWTMFFCDPFGNPIEVKGFASLESLYAS